MTLESILLIIWGGSSMTLLFFGGGSSMTLEPTILVIFGGEFRGFRAYFPHLRGSSSMREERIATTSMLIRPRQRERRAENLGNMILKPIIGKYERAIPYHQYVIV